MRAIVVLEQLDDSERVGFRVCFRLKVPAARQPFYVNPDAKSAVIGAPQEELDQLRAGALVERVEALAYPKNTSATQVRARLVAALADFQAEIDALNPWARYGTSWDDVAQVWTNAAVA